MNFFNMIAKPKENMLKCFLSQTVEFFLQMIFYRFKYFFLFSLEIQNFFSKSKLINFRKLFFSSHASSRSCFNSSQLKSKQAMSLIKVSARFAVCLNELINLLLPLIRTGSQNNVLINNTYLSFLTKWKKTCCYFSNTSSNLTTKSLYSSILPHHYCYKDFDWEIWLKFFSLFAILTSLYETFFHDEICFPTETRTDKKCSINNFYSENFDYCYYYYYRY